VFTGIVEELGEVVGIEPGGGASSADQADSAVLVVRCSIAAEEVPHGSSIATNGVCLTVIGDEPATGADGGPARQLRFDVMGETLRRSGIGLLKPGDQVNLERALPAHGRLDGHIVQGHVDGTATVLSRVPGDGWETVRFRLPDALARYVAEKGSIAIDGVSLTVAALGVDQSGEWFEVGLIPETLRATNLGTATPGSVVNLEVDVLAKYAERLFARAGYSPPSAQQGGALGAGIGEDDISETVRA
jgi:riboflavin synthase